MIDATRKIYFSPDDDTVDAFLAFIKSATKKILIADYSFNLDPLVEVLMQKHQEGVDVQLVLDRSQAAGSTEKPEVAKLKAAGISYVVGTSDKHKIMHNKFTIIDDTVVQYGSWNYTKAASDENNFFVVENNSDIAAVFKNHWQEMWDWISKNEGGVQ